MTGGRSGKYDLIALLARGGQADVFVAVSRDPLDFGRHVVIKRLDPGSDPDVATRMFLDEASVAERLRHPNIVRTYETGHSDDHRYISMEYLDGQTLSRVRRAVRDVPPEIWVWIAAEVLAGLAYAHEARDDDGTPLRIVHCDVSPQNIFLTYGGEVKIIDFGIARWVHSRSEIGMLRGKVRYMAPEQALGRVDARSDLFSLGAVLWEAIAQRRLYEGDEVAVIEALLRGAPPSLAAVVPDVDPELDAIVTTALARDPAARFQRATDMREALLTWSRRRGISVTHQLVAGVLDAPFRAAREQTHLLLEQASLATPRPTCPLLSVAPPSSRSVLAVGATTRPAAPEAASSSLSPPVLLTAPPPPSPVARRRGAALAAGATLAVVLSATALTMAFASYRRGMRSATASSAFAARLPRVADETSSPIDPLVRARAERTMAPEQPRRAPPP